MKTLVALLFIFASALPAKCIILSDNFDADGFLNGSFPQSGGQWTALFGTSQVVKGGGVVFIDPGANQDVDSFFTPISSATLYAGFTLSVIAAPTTPWILPITFLGNNSSGGNQVGRLFVSSGSTATSYSIGIENNMDNPVWWPFELQADQDYRIVLSFTENGAMDVTRMWLDPTSMADTFITETAEDIAPSIYGLRLHAFNGSDGSLSIDDLLVDTSFAIVIPEPSVVSLLLLAVGALIVTRKRSNDQGCGGAENEPQTAPSC